MQVPGCQASETIIQQLQERRFIQKVPPPGKNQHCRRDVWYAPNTDGGKTQGFATYSMMSGCLSRNVLKRITQNLLSKIIKLLKYT
jgi:hypothetical protein